MSIEIIHLSDNYENWDKYVFNNPHGTLFHTSHWMKAIEKTFKLCNKYFLLLENNDIKGILPLFYVNSLFSGKKAISIPYAVYGGIIADNENYEKLLLKFAMDEIKKQQIGILELRNMHESNYPFSKQDLYVTFVKKLGDSEEKILTGIPRKSRASIRNGYQKYNLKSVVNKDVERLYQLYLLNKRNLGSPPYPKTFFKNLILEFADHSGILFIEYDGTLISGVIFFIYKDTIYPYFSGADKRYNFTNSNNVLYYELMKYALNLGLSYFDFGRSRIDTGAAAFKKNMGFEEKPLNYYYYNQNKKPLPNISPSNKKFDLVSGIWSKLPLGVTELIGPHIVKRIP